MNRGKFIVFSGGEGSGKTTQIQRLKGEFPQIVTTREPGGTPAGIRIRGILVDDAQLDLHVQTELYLFLADRAEHMAKVVIPALAEGKVVVSDRHWMDTFAYQWYATMGRLDLGNFLKYFSEWKWPEPDLWIWFDVDPAAGLIRRRETTEFNRIDQRTLKFHELVRQGFSHIYGAGDALHGLRWPKVWIDANQSADDVYAEVKQHLLPMLKS